MADRRVAERPLDESAAAAANAAVAPHTGGKPIREDQDDLQEMWMDAYVAAGGKLVGEPSGRKPDDICEECEKKKLAVSLLELEVLSDHGVMKDNFSDWKNTGAVIKPPDWKGGVGNAISHSRSEKVRVKVTFEVGEPGAAAEQGELRGLNADGQTFFAGSARFAPGKPTAVTLQSKLPLGDLVEEQAFAIDWQVKTKKTYLDWTSVGTTSANPLYVTFHKPIDESGREDGVTQMRMETAVEWVGHEKTDEHSKILEYMFSHFDRYVLSISHLSEAEQKTIEGDPDLKKRLGDVDWPKYFNDAEGNAWPIPELKPWGAECQAICRLVLGMLRQVGSNRDVKLVYIAADFSKPEEPKEITKPTGPDPTKRYALADAPVVVGRTYWQPKPGETAEVGWNNFEAYLKYTWKGYSRWYGGGVGLIEQGMNPLHVFHALVEYEIVDREVTEGGSTRTEFGRKITRAHFYR